MTPPTPASPTVDAGDPRSDPPSDLRGVSAAVVLGAGTGSRVGARIDGVPVNKVLLPLGGVPVLARSLLTALEAAGRVVLVVRAEEVGIVAEAIGPHLPADAEVSVVAGGASRHGSEWAALRALASEVEAGSIELVAIHDGARPLASVELWRACLTAAREHGGAVPAVAMPGLLGHDLARPTLPAGGLLAGMQTPQAFRAAPLLAAYRSASADGFEGTDTASCFAAYTDLPVVAVPGSATNLKVTFPEDLALAERLLAR